MKKPRRRGEKADLSAQAAEREGETVRIRSQAAFFAAAQMTG